MKKNIKILLSILLSIGLLFILNSYVYAASTSLSAKSTKVKEGDTITVTASVTAAQWDLAISVNGTTIASSSELDNYKSNINKTFSGTYKATSAGTVVFTLSGDITDVDQTNSTVNKTVSVTVEKKASSNTSGSNTSSGSSSSGSSTSKPSTPTTTAPKFTSVSQTVYATDDGINVRSSYSTSSAAIGSLKKGESLKRTGIATTTINGIKWSKVTYNGQTAYVSSAYLTTTKPVVEETKKEEPKKEETKVDNTTKNEISNNEITNNNEISNNTNTEKPVENNEENNVTNTTNEELRLSKLEIAGVNFSEGFNPEIFSYTLQLNFFVKDLNITAEANKADAQVEIIGNENFIEGENNVTILVNSADNKETVTYQIKVVIPAEVATSPQNDIQFYLIGGGIILVAIVAIAIITSIYKNKNNANEYVDNKTEVNELFTNTLTEEKTKKEKTKGGKHSN